MTALIEVNTDYAGDEKLQQVIIKCLDEDDDRTIGKKVRNGEFMYFLFSDDVHTSPKLQRPIFLKM
jgi:hypothetical protein